MEKLILDTSINAWLKFCKLYPKLKLQDAPKVVISNRLTKTAGYMDYEKRSIVLARKIFVIPGNSKEFLEIVIPHEVAHMVDFDLYGIPKKASQKEFHRESWQKIMVAYGIKPDQYHTLIT